MRRVASQFVSLVLVVALVAAGWVDAGRAGIDTASAGPPWAVTAGRPEPAPAAALPQAEPTAVELATAHERSWPAAPPPDCRVERPDPGCAVPEALLAPEFAALPADPTGAEDWRDLVEVFFRAGDVDRAVRVIRCESHGDPDAKNPRSTASGLFQHLGSAWPDRALRAGYPASEVFDPIANVAVAAWLVYAGGGWSHWNASRHCWA